MNTWSTFTKDRKLYFYEYMAVDRRAFALFILYFWISRQNSRVLRCAIIFSQAITV